MEELKQIRRRVVMFVAVVAVLAIVTTGIIHM